MPSDLSFAEFERQGWSAQQVTLGYDAYFSPVTRQAIGALLDAARVRTGTRVADIATGAGYGAAAAAERGAVAVGIDMSAAQLELARRNFPAVEYREGDASALPLPSSSFDVVISNFGMPHFPDPDAFFRETFRVLDSGGRLAFSTWTAPEECVGFGMIYSAVQAHGRMDVALPSGPSFFLFSDPGHCQRSLEAAGFRSISVARVSLVWRVTSADLPFEAIMNGSVRAAALLRAQTPEALTAIRQAIRETARTLSRDGEIEIPMPAVIAAGEKP
jgi:SAM-dependent methyltransferase